MRRRSTARERENLVGGQLDGSSATHALHHIPAAASAATADLLEDGDIVADTELGFGIRQQPKPFADFDRDGDLSLRGDLHRRSEYYLRR